MCEKVEIYKTLAAVPAIHIELANIVLPCSLALYQNNKLLNTARINRNNHIFTITDSGEYYVVATIENGREIASE
ncbi:hypothetical protein [Dryocola clanedunensis]